MRRENDISDFPEAITDQRALNRDLNKNPDHYNYHEFSSYKLDIKKPFGSFLKKKEDPVIAYDDKDTTFAAFLAKRKFNISYIFNLDTEY